MEKEGIAQPPDASAAASVVAETKKKKKKSKKRVRAHVNVFSPREVPPPVSPEAVDWTAVFPGWREGAEVTMLDVGCGFGGLLEHLSPVWPQRFILGAEIRDRVVEAVEDRLSKLRQKDSAYGNLGVVNMNAMKHLPNYFRRGQLLSMFFLYADPHFQKAKHKRRIINVDLCDTYAYMLRPGGRLYTATDVEDLHNSQVEALDAHPCFERLSQEECNADPNVPVMLNATDEEAKAKREGRGQWYSVYQRRENTNA